MCARTASSSRLDGDADDATEEYGGRIAANSSVLFDEHDQDNPFSSNRDELIDIEAAIAMKLTAPPSASPHLVSTNFRGPQPQSDTNSNGAEKPFGGSYHGENPTFYSSDADLKEFIAFVGECADSFVQILLWSKHSFLARLVRIPNLLLFDTNDDGLSSKTKARTSLERKHRDNTAPYNRHGDTDSQ